jgi:gliding motility-associated-like protein
VRGEKTVEPGTRVLPRSCANPVSSAIQTITYMVTGTDVSGCISTDSVLVTVVPSYVFFIPNAFTPNNDGNNDNLEVFGNKEAWKQFEVKVFNRWGEKVFESQDPNFKWDGTYQGRSSNPGVFVYLVKLVYLNNYTDKVYTGTVTLIR